MSLGFFNYNECQSSETPYIKNTTSGNSDMMSIINTNECIACIQTILSCDIMPDPSLCENAKRKIRETSESTCNGLVHKITGLTPEIIPDICKSVCNNTTR